MNEPIKPTIPLPEVEAALREIGYKYFGSYEFTEAQDEAVNTLEKVVREVYDIQPRGRRTQPKQKETL